jgi:hypothetical protein
MVCSLPIRNGNVLIATVENVLFRCCRSMTGGWSSFDQRKLLSSMANWSHCHTFHVTRQIQQQQQKIQQQPSPQVSCHNYALSHRHRCISNDANNSTVATINNHHDNNNKYYSPSIALPVLSTLPSIHNNNNNTTTSIDVETSSSSSSLPEKKNGWISYFWNKYSISGQQYRIHLAECLYQAASRQAHHPYVWCFVLCVCVLFCSSSSCMVMGMFVFFLLSLSLFYLDCY